MADEKSQNFAAAKSESRLHAEGAKGRYPINRLLVTCALCGIALLALVAWTLGETAVPTNRLAPAGRLPIDSSDHEARSHRFPVTIHHPDGPPRVATGETDPRGQPVTVSCVSCHSNLPPKPLTDSGEALSEFHQGLEFRHGQLTCLSCHHADDYNRLRFADGRPLEFSRVQALCAQCHAPQARDYERGAHGGMQGYWDLTRGPRTRKNCIDCHDPHAPAFPRMIPSFRPLDRFLSTPRQEADHNE
jgi:formate-dependent nitrite reductase cytochrome c552 subunit